MQRVTDSFPRKADYFPPNTRGHLTVASTQKVLDLFAKTAERRGVSLTYALKDAGCSKDLMNRSRGKEISAAVYARLKIWILNNTPEQSK